MNKQPTTISSKREADQQPNPNGGKAKPMNDDQQMNWTTNIHWDLLILIPIRMLMINMMLEINTYETKAS